MFSEWPFALFSEIKVTCPTTGTRQQNPMLYNQQCLPKIPVRLNNTGDVGYIVLRLSKRPRTFRVDIFVCLFCLTSFVWKCPFCWFPWKNPFVCMRIQGPVFSRSRCVFSVPYWKFRGRSFKLIGLMQTFLFFKLHFRTIVGYF